MITGLDMKQAILDVFADGQPKNFRQIREATGLHFQALEVALGHLTGQELEQGYLDPDGNFLFDVDYLVYRAWRLR